MKIASIQMTPVEESKDAAVEKAAALIRKCGDADLVMLPEMWNIGFMSFDRYLTEAEDMEGPTLTMLKELAGETGVHLHTGSFVIKEKDRFFNTSFLLSPQAKEIARYRKIHLFGHQSKENQLLTPGTETVVAETPFGKAGLATCFDLRFPELFRNMVDQGARLFLVCSAWPYPRLEHWLMLTRVRALENQSFLISANAAGTNRGTMFTGHSMVIDPWGTIRAGAGDGETIVRAEIDPDEADRARISFPSLSSRSALLNPHQEKP